MSATSLAAAPVAALLLGVLIQLCLSPLLSPRAKGRIALVSGLAALLAAISLVPTVNGGRVVTTTLFDWDSGTPLRYHIDGLSLLFVLMATGIGTAILLYCIEYMADEREGATRFYVLMLLFMAGLVNLVCCADLLLMYASWEVIGLCSYFLVGFWYTDPAASEGARKVLVMTHLPGYGLLAAVLIVFSRTGSFAWPDPAVRQAFTGGLFLLILLAAMAKSVLVPLHTWIPEAMQAPTPVSALLHSACYVKAGVYLIARTFSFMTWPAGGQALVLTLGCATILVGAVFALRETDLKRLLAFSTVSQLGFIVTGLGLGTKAGVTAGLFYCLSHGLFKATLFLCAGVVQHAAGTRDLSQLGGLAARLPRTAFLWILAAAAIVGVPLTNGFIAKWLLYTAALDGSAVVVVLIAWIGSVLSSLYMLKATVATFFGDLPPALKHRQLAEAPGSMQVGIGVLSVGCVVFGIAPQLTMQWVVNPAAMSLGFPPAESVSWLGISGTSGASGALAAGVIMIALLVGGVLYSVATPRRDPAVGIFTGGDPLPAVGQVVTASDFLETIEDTFAPAYRALNPDPLYRAVWVQVRGIGERMDQGLTPMIEAHPFWAAAAAVGVTTLLLSVFS